MEDLITNAFTLSACFATIFVIMLTLDFCIVGRDGHMPDTYKSIGGGCAILGVLLALIGGILWLVRIIL